MNQPLSHPLKAAEQTDFAARFTAAEFVRMIEIGAFDDMKVELIGGRLDRMNPAMSDHGRMHGDACYELRNIFDRTSGFLVLIDTAIVVAEDSVLGGDIVVVRGEPDHNRVLEPADVLLVLEVSVTTRSRDSGSKRIAYAAAAIPHYWVVDVERRVTHVYGDPVAGDYAEVSTVRFGRPLAVPGSERTIILG